MPDPEIPSPDQTPASPTQPEDAPAGAPMEAPAPIPTPGEESDGRAYDQG